ncbi:hypothetical protein ACOSQ4_002007 [Xanthoceras sorbifolium]
MKAEEDHHYQQQQQQSGAFYELCYMILNILKPIPDPYLVAGPSSSTRTEAVSQVSPAAFASLLLRISLVLMLFGSISFVIGFVLMPWIIGLVFLFYFAGLVSSFFFFCSTDVCGKVLSSCFSFFYFVLFF